MYSTKKSSGSALVYSLIVLFMLLTAALGVASVSVIERKNASTTGKSVQSFQVADSAIEMVLDKALKDPTANLSQVATLFTGGLCNGATNVVSGKILGNDVELIFKKGGETMPCGTTLAAVDEVKAVGQYSSTTRAISAAVAAGTTYTQLFDVTGNSDFVGASSNYIAKGKSQALIMFSGIVYKDTLGTAGEIGINIKVDNVTKGTANAYYRASEHTVAGVYKLVSGTAIISGLTAGQTYNIKIEKKNVETKTGPDSRLSALIIE